MSDQHRHQLELAGYNALLAEHCELMDRLAALERRLTILERFWVVQAIEDLNDHLATLASDEHSPISDS
jgi:hypothetical protein